MARSAPKDCVFASLLIDGDAAFLHESGCVSATAGNLVIYETRQPYLFGFSSPMRRILVDIPREAFTEACLPGGVPVPMLFGRESADEEHSCRAFTRCWVIWSACGPAGLAQRRPRERYSS